MHRYQHIIEVTHFSESCFDNIFNFIPIGTVDQSSANGGTSLTDPNCSAVESPRRLWPGATWAVAQLGSHSQSSLGSWAAGIGELCLWKAAQTSLGHGWHGGSGISDAYLVSRLCWVQWNCLHIENVGRKFAAFLTRALKYEACRGKLRATGMQPARGSVKTDVELRIFEVQEVIWFLWMMCCRLFGVVLKF